jgi:hypothetical protein
MVKRPVAAGLAALLAVFGAIVAVAALQPKSAYATQAKAPTNWSWYVQSSSTTTAYNLGYSQGQSDAADGWNSEVVLDFGTEQQNANNGTITINGIYLSPSQVEGIVEQFAYGYWDGTGADSTTDLILAMGTNTSAYSVTYGGGQTWAGFTNTVANWVSSEGITSQLYIEAANDIEPSWSSFSAAQSWVQGFEASGPSRQYLDYGSADGCPLGTSANGSCSNGWNQYDVWWVAFGTVPAFITPEIYYDYRDSCGCGDTNLLDSGQVGQWYQISRYGYTYQSVRIYFDGPWDEHDLDSTTLTSTQAWDYFWNQLNSYSGTASDFQYSNQIHDE